MGVLRNDFGEGFLCSAQWAGFAIRALILVGTVAVATATLTASAVSDGREDTPVSTRPIEASDAHRSVQGQATVTQPSAQPLTRAAARSRIESISPVVWLARFGAVDVQYKNVQYKN